MSEERNNECLSTPPSTRFQCPAPLQEYSIESLIFCAITLLSFSVIHCFIPEFNVTCLVKCYFRNEQLRWIVFKHFTSVDACKYLFSAKIITYWWAKYISNGNFISQTHKNWVPLQSFISILAFLTMCFQIYSASEWTLEANQNLRSSFIKNVILLSKNNFHYEARNRWRLKISLWCTSRKVLSSHMINEHVSTAHVHSEIQYIRHNNRENKFLC